MDWQRELGYAPGNSRDTVKRKYRRLAFAYHPDKAQLQAKLGGVPTADGAKFNRLTVAWQAAQAFFNDPPRPRTPSPPARRPSAPARRQPPRQEPPRQQEPSRQYPPRQPRPSAQYMTGGFFKRSTSFTRPEAPYSQHQERSTPPQQPTHGRAPYAPWVPTPVTEVKPVLFGGRPRQPYSRVDSFPRRPRS